LNCLASVLCSAPGSPLSFQEEKVCLETDPCSSIGRAAIRSALLYWSHDSETYRPELARTTLLKARLLEKMGQSDKANNAYKVAGRLWMQLASGDKRDVRGLEPSDFAPYLMFYHR
jgi:hypothetical protein